MQVVQCTLHKGPSGQMGPCSRAVFFYVCFIHIRVNVYFIRIHKNIHMTCYATDELDLVRPSVLILDLQDRAWVKYSWEQFCCQYRESAELFRLPIVIFGK